MSQRYCGLLNLVTRDFRVFAPDAASVAQYSNLLEGLSHTLTSATGLWLLRHSPQPPQATMKIHNLTQVLLSLTNHHTGAKGAVLILRNFAMWFLCHCSSIASPWS